MIIPIKPFSITVEGDGFSANKGYPVLAIAMRKTTVEDVEDQVSNDDEVEEEYTEDDETGSDGSQDEKPTSMAYFLVADDYSDFVWVGETECKYFK